MRRRRPRARRQHNAPPPLLSEFECPARTARKAHATLALCTLPASVQLQKRRRHPRDWAARRWATTDLGGDARGLANSTHELLLRLQDGRQAGRMAAASARPVCSAAVCHAASLQAVVAGSYSSSHSEAVGVSAAATGWNYLSGSGRAWWHRADSPGALPILSNSSTTFRRTHAPLTREERARRGRRWWTGEAARGYKRSLISAGVVV